MATKKLYRDETNSEIMGVCAGLAEYFDIDVTIIRVLFVLGIFITSGFMVLAYFVLGIIIPTKPKSNNSSESKKSIEENFKYVTTELSSGKNSARLRNLFGLGLIAVGLWFLLALFIPVLITINWGFIWPLALVFIGILVIIKSKG